MSDTLKLADFLPYRLSVLSNRISQGIADLYEERFGITLNQWRIMAVLGGEPDISAGEVAERTAMDKVAVSRSIKKMLASDLLERHFAAEDRRRSVLALSETGQEIYEQIVPMAREFEARLLESLTDGEIAGMDQVIRKLMDSSPLNIES